MIEITDYCHKCYAQLDGDTQCEFDPFVIPYGDVFEFKGRLVRWHGVEVVFSEEDQFVQVMDWADATLNDEMRTKQICNGTDATAVIHIMRGLALAMQHMHQARRAICTKMPSG